MLFSGYEEAQETDAHFHVQIIQVSALHLLFAALGFHSATPAQDFSVSRQGTDGLEVSAGNGSPHPDAAPELPDVAASSQEAESSSPEGPPLQPRLSRGTGHTLQAPMCTPICTSNKCEVAFLMKKCSPRRIEAMRDF